MIYNPYFSSIDCALQPAGRRADESPLSGLLSRLGQLDGETLLLLGSSWSFFGRTEKTVSCFHCCVQSYIC